MSRTARSIVAVIAITITAVPSAAYAKPSQDPVVTHQDLVINHYVDQASPGLSAPAPALAK